MAHARVRRYGGISATALHPELIALYVHRTLLRIGFASTNVFTVVLIYQQFNNSLIAVLLAYGAMHVGVFLFTPITSKLLGSIGVRTMLLLAVPSVVLSVISMYYLATDPAIIGYALVGFAFFMAVYRSLYWVPYQVDFSLLLDKANRGRQIAFLRNSADVLLVFMPLVGGFIVARLGFDILFLFAIAVMAMSIVPVFFTQTFFERFSWSYRKTLEQFVTPENRALVLAQIGNGMQAIAVLAIWPLFVFLLLGEEYIALGFITALTLMSILILRSVTGGLFDRWNKRRIVTIGAILAATGWLVKVVVVTPVQVFFADTYHGMGREMNKTSVDAMTYEQAADSGRYIDEYTTLKEMAMALGRVIMLIITGVVLVLFEIQLAFVVALVVAALATLATMLLSDRVAMR